MVRLLIFSPSADRRAHLCGFSAASFLFDLAVCRDAYRAAPKGGDIGRTTTKSERAGPDVGG
jgi:hypothetical protein